MATKNEDDESNPRRFIFDQTDMQQFMASDRKKEILSFVEAMGKSCAFGEGSFSPSEPLVGYVITVFSIRLILFSKKLN